MTEQKPVEAKAPRASRRSLLLLWVVSFLVAGGIVSLNLSPLATSLTMGAYLLIGSAGILWYTRRERTRADRG